MPTPQTKTKSAKATQCTITGHVIVGLDADAVPVYDERAFQFDETWVSPEPEILSGVGDKITLVVANMQAGKMFAVYGRSDDTDRFWIAKLSGETILEVNGAKEMDYDLTWEYCAVAPMIVNTTFMSWRHAT